MSIPPLPTREEAIDALKPLGRYFKPTRAPAFKEGGIFIAINAGHHVSPDIRDAEDKIEEACKKLGMHPMLSGDTSGRPAYNPASPEVAFLAVIKEVLGLTDEAKTVLLMPPRYIQIHGEENLRKLAEAGIEFPNYKNHLSATEKLHHDNGDGGMTRVSGGISDPRQHPKEKWTE